jgi:fibronectin type 3 domain-containing protein
VEATDCTFEDKVQITWDSVSGATYYEVHRAESESGTKTKLGEPTSTSFDDTTVELNETYYYWVKACGTSECSPFSDADQGSACCDVPDAPAEVQATDGTYGDRIAVTWDAVTGATSYRVYRADSPEGSQTEIGSPGGTSFEDTSVTPGVNYYYWVKACNECGCGDASTYDSGYAGSIDLDYAAYLPLIVR